MSWQHRIELALAERQAADALRSRLPVTLGAGRWLSREAAALAQFFQQRLSWPQPASGYRQGPAAGADRYGVGSGGSGHVSGYSEAHRALEEQLAGWLGYPRALLFISGFAANQAVIAALAGKEDRIVADRLSHASLLEAASLSPAQLRRFQHNDSRHLDDLLAKPLSGQQLVVTEGIFSMDGDSAPLAEVYQAARAAGALLLVDDAHGIGALGEEGAAAATRSRYARICLSSPSVKRLASAARRCCAARRWRIICCSLPAI